MTTISLLVLPGVTVDHPLSFYLEENQLWYEIKYALQEPRNPNGFRLTVNRQLKEQMKNFEDSPGATGVPPVIKLIGRRLADFFPGDLVKYLKDVAAKADPQGTPCLRIHTTIDWIPWELMYIDSGYLGVIFQIARLPIQTQASRLNTDVRDVRPVRQICNLLGKDVLDAEQRKTWGKTWESTFATLLANANHEFRRPSSISIGDDFPNVGTFDELDPLPDIVHITCHGDLSDVDQSSVYWTLDHTAPNLDEYRIDAENIKFIMNDARLHENRPLVFGNACSSANAVSEDKGKLLEGFGAEFIRGSASAFIGTFAPVSKKMAIDFACEFYQRLLKEQLSIGEALLATKQHFQAQNERDPSWLFYCLYGPPTIKYQLQP